jgi:hypothetical protein
MLRLHPSFPLILVACGLTACPDTSGQAADGEAEQAEGTNAEGKGEGEGNGSEGEGDEGDEGEGDGGGEGGEGEGAFDPDGTAFPLAGVGFASGAFVDRLEAAFDGVTDQATAASASTPIYLNLQERPLLFREFDCELALRRVVVHAPTDAGFLTGAEGATNTGTVHVVGRRPDNTSMQTISSLPISAGNDAEIVFDLAQLGAPTTFVAYGVLFEADDPRVGTVQVAEVELFGFCAAPSATISWQATPFICSDVDCTAAENPGGIERRTVTCARTTGGTANEAMCEGEKPNNVGDVCALNCPYALTFVGLRDFSYNNGSGWLHEGNATQRAGPLPSAVEFGTSVEVIEGQPCSIQTTDPLTSFSAISCQPDGALYCAFRCE